MNLSSKIIITPLVIAIVFAGCGKQEDAKAETSAEAVQQTSVKLSPQSIKEIDLQSVVIGKKSVSNEITVPAKILADQDNEALVGSLVPGRVYKVFVRVGDYVKAGQNLMLIEGLEIGEIKAQFLTAQANLNYQKVNFERQKKLFDENIGSQKAYLEAQNEYDKSLAEYSANENRLKAIHLSGDEVVNERKQPSNGKEFCTLPVKSSIDGVVIERNVVIGQSIDESENAFRIVNLRSVRADGQIYEKDIGKISGNVQATFTSVAFPTETFTGKISYIGQTIDEKTRTITVRAEFNNAHGKLKPQMFGELRIPIAKTEALVVPAEALAKIDNADYVFIRKGDETFEKTLVTIGQTQNEFTEISTGLTAGDVVVVKGSSYLKAELLKASLGEGE